MGDLMLNNVLECLREAGLRADMAFPGKAYTAVTEPVAAVHLETVDRGDSSVVVAVHIQSPAVLGGAACEAAGLRAVEALDAAGAACVQKGCEYDGARKIYGVKILAAFTGVVGTGGFSVTVGTAALPCAVAFSAEESRENELRYVTGELLPAAVSRGRIGWNLVLVERIPAGVDEPELGNEAVSLCVTRNGKREIYHNCLWTSVKREYTKEGLTVTRKGIAASREVE